MNCAVNWGGWSMHHSATKVKDQASSSMAAKTGVLFVILAFAPVGCHRAAHQSVLVDDIVKQGGKALVQEDKSGRRLVEGDLQSTGINDEFIRMMQQCYYLRGINLQDTRVTDQALVYLGSLPEL